MASASQPGKTPQAATARRSVAAAVQERLNVGPANDTYEQEADRTAQRVTRGRPGASASRGAGPSTAGPIISRSTQRQRRTAAEEKEVRLQRQTEDEEPQMRVQRQAEEEEVQARVEPRATRRDKREYPRLGRVEGTLFDTKGEGEPLPDETAVGEGAAEAGAEETALEAPQATPENVAAEGEGEVPEEIPSAEAPAEAAAPPVKGEEAPGGVGAYLRRTTKEVVKEKKKRVQTLAKHQKRTEDVRTKVRQSEESVEPPTQEAASRAQASQVDAVDRVPAPEPDEERARRKFDQTLEDVVPRTLKEVDQFKEQGKGRIVGEAVKGVVTADAQEVQSTYQRIEETPEPEPAEPAAALPDIETAPETPSMALGEGVVGEVQPEHMDMSGFEEKSDALLEKEGITEEQLQMVDAGELAEAKTERQDLSARVEQAPSEVKMVERAEKERVSQELKAEEQEGRKGMQAERRRELQRVRGDQQRTKTEMEARRQQVADQIIAIYERANTTVGKKLDELEEQSLQAFDDGQEKATRTFENNVQSRMDAFKKKRYDRVGGSTLWLKDKLLGMDDLPQVKRIFESEKSRFISAVEKLIGQITADNEKVIRDCKDTIAEARKEIEAYLEGLEPALQQTGEQAYAQMKSKLDALDHKIDEKAQQLHKKLEAKRKRAIKAIEEKIEKMKEEMSGLVSNIGSLLLNAALKFFKWVLKKAGFDAERFIGLIDKGKTVLEKIVRDPLGFLRNLIAGVKGGMESFGKNVKQHLVGGLVDWLTGVMSSLPIELPETWNLRGVTHLVLQILGMTWQRIRAKLVKRLGERVVRIAEGSVDIIRRLVTEGPIALWNMIKAKAAEIKEKVMESIRGWAIAQLVKQGIIRLVGMLNPAGAIVQAVLAIYNAVMFFVENWERISTFAQTVVSTIADIAKGKVGVVVKAVENAMAQTIPMILSFIARLLNISGISKAIANAIEKIRRPIDRIVEKAIGKMVKLARKIVSRVKKGAEALKEKGLALIRWWRQKRSFTSKDGGKHRLYYRGKGRQAVLVVASEGPENVDAFLKRKQTEASDNAEQRAAVKRAQDAYADYTKVEDEIQKLEVRKANANSDKEKRSVNNAIKREETNLRNALDVFSKSLRGLHFELESDAMVKTHVGPTSGSKADFVEARPLTWLSGNTTGSRPAEDPPGWEHAVKVDTDPETRKRRYNWVRGHLLNENLHGPGRTWNLVPITQKTNAEMRDGPEQDAREGVAKKGNILHYRTSVDFHGGDPPVSHFPAKITVQWGYGKEGSHSPSNFVEKTSKSATFTQDPPPEKASDVVYNVNDVGRETIIRETGVVTRFGRAMTIEQTSDRGRFTSFEQFKRRMSKHHPLYQSADSVGKYIEAIREASTGEGRTLRFDND